MRSMLTVLLLLVSSACGSKEPAAGRSVDVDRWPGPRCEASSTSCPRGFACVQMSPLDPARTYWTCQIPCEGPLQTCPTGFECTGVLDGSPRWCARKK